MKAFLGGALLALLLAAGDTAFANVPIAGGTKAQQQRLRKALGSVPTCMSKCAPLTIGIERKDEMQATYGFGQVSFYDALFGGKAYQRAMAAMRIDEPCVTPATMKWMLNPERILLHEIAHHFHDACSTGGKTNRDRLKAFLALPGGYNAKVKALRADAVMNQHNAALEKFYENKPDPKKAPAQFKQWTARYCATLDRAIDRFKTHGFPSRARGDDHAITGWGSEYVAIAIETLAYDHEEFCRSYTPAEIQWLKTNFGTCLDTLQNRAPCYDKPPQPADPKEMAKLIDEMLSLIGETPARSCPGAKKP